MTDTAQPLVCGTRKTKSILFLVLCLAFVAGGVWMIDEYGTARRGFGLSVSFWGWVVVVFFGLCSALLIATLFQSGPMFRANAQGIWYKAGFRSAKEIPWSAIANVDLTRQSGQRFLSVWLTEDAAAAADLGRGAKSNLALGHGHVTIHLSMLNRKPEEIAARTRELRSIYG